MFEKAPMAYPGVFWDTFRAFVKRRSPMTVNSFFDPDLIKWGWNFYKASKIKKFSRTCAVLEHFGEEVFEFYDHLQKNEEK